VTTSSGSLAGSGALWSAARVGPRACAAVVVGLLHLPVELSLHKRGKVLGGTRRAGEHELLAENPLTARAQGGELGGWVARRVLARAWRGEGHLSCALPRLLLYDKKETPNGSL
jgi:hypothetical protein